MANTTKTQFKNTFKKLMEELSDIRIKLEDLQSDLETESGDIEPYEGRNYLTSAQEERQDWLDGAASEIETSVGNLQEAEDALDNLICE